MSVQSTISYIVESLKHINGISALVLGGSRARGTEGPNSDIDIGIYYDSDKGLDIPELRRIATVLDDEHRDNLVTEAVDFLLRDQNKVSRVIEQCAAGELTIDYQPGHPHGFVNSIYFAEVASCKVLWDPSGVIDKLKNRTKPYPPAFQKATLQKFFWEASFSLENGYKGVYKNDLSYVAGCCFRAVACLNQVLFAINETCLMNEKGAAAIADSFKAVPDSYSQRINHIFTLLTAEQDSSREALGLLRKLIDETERLLKSETLSR